MAGVECIVRHRHGRVGYGAVAEAVAGRPCAGDDRAAGYAGVEDKTAIRTDRSIGRDPQRGAQLCMYLRYTDLHQT